MPQQRSQRLLLEIIGLQTPRGRLIFFLVASVVIFTIPYDWLANLSIWQALNIPAPSIGLTRAYHKLLHLDFVGAWYRNPLIYLVMFIGLPLLVRDGWQIFNKTPDKRSLPAAATATTTATTSTATTIRTASRRTGR